MAVTPGFLGIDEPATIDKRADTNTMTRAATAVHREVVSVGSPDDTLTENIAAVTNAAPAGTEQGLHVRQTGALPAGTNNIGDVDVLTAPDPAYSHTRNEVFGQSAAIGGELDDVAPIAATEGNVSPARITAQRALHSNLRNDAGTEIGTATTPVRVDPTGTTTQPVSDAGGSLTVDAPLATPVHTRISDGVDVVNVSAAGALQVDGSAVTQPVSGTVTANQGTPAVTANRWPVQITDGTDLALVTAAGAVVVDGSAVTQPVSGTVTANQGGAPWSVHGDTAHDAVDANNPVKVGGKASLNEPTAVADADRVNAWIDQIGRFVVLTGHANPEPPDTSNVTASGDTTIIAAPGVGVSLHICKGSIHNAGAANVVVALRDGVAGTIRWQAELASEGGGAAFDFGNRGWKLTANTALVANLGAAGNVDINVTEFYVAA